MLVRLQRKVDVLYYPLMLDEYLIALSHEIV